MQPSLDGVSGVDHLYIGGLFSLRRKEALKNANITHVLSALQLPLDRDLFAAYTHRVIEVEDVDDEDILQHFAASNAFIQEGLDSGGGVLVHCAMGKSRSATLIIAYLLSLRLPRARTPTSALSLLRTTHSLAEPNPGFMAQLSLYHRMGCPVDVAAHPLYQHWLYEREVETSNACKTAPDLEWIVFEDEESPQIEKEVKKELDQNIAAGGEEVELRCRKCRRSLATSQSLRPHAAKSSLSSSPSSKQSFNQNAFASLPSPASTLPCMHYFLDPLSWMRPELALGHVEGRLQCPNSKCKTNVGKYAWQGLKCSCGEWVVPGLSLQRSRVDEASSAQRGDGVKGMGLRMPPGMRSGGNL